MTQYTLHQTAPCRPLPARRWSLTALFFGLSALWRSRQALRDLDDARLQDLGLSASEVSKEAARAPWDVPAHWLD